MYAKRRLSWKPIIVVIVILIVIAIIAIPAWRSHETRTHVADALQTTAAAKLVVMEAATIHGGLANVSAEALAYKAPVATNPYVASISIADSGVITLATKSTGASPDPVLVLIPANGSADAAATIIWTCTLATGDASAVPVDCRGSVPARQVMPPASAASAGNSPG
ncbi:MAG: pilin [Rhodanobacter sp.]